MNPPLSTDVTHVTQTTSKNGKNDSTPQEIRPKVLPIDRYDNSHILTELEMPASSAFALSNENMFE